MIVTPVSRELLGQLVALEPCPDCASGVAILAPHVDAYGVAQHPVAAITHSSETCPSVAALPPGSLYLVVPEAGG